MKKYVKIFGISIAAMIVFIAGSATCRYTGNQSTIGLIDSELKPFIDSYVPVPDNENGYHAMITACGKLAKYPYKKYDFLLKDYPDIITTPEQADCMSARLKIFAEDMKLFDKALEYKRIEEPECYLETGKTETSWLFQNSSGIKVAIHNICARAALAEYKGDTEGAITELLSLIRLNLLFESATGIYPVFAWHFGGRTGCMRTTSFFERNKPEKKYCELALRFIMKEYKRKKSYSRFIDEAYTYNIMSHSCPK